MASVVARYNFNPYYGLKFNLQTGKMKGSSADVKTYYPAFATKPYEFSNTLVGLDITLRIQLLALRHRQRLPWRTAADTVHLRRIGRHIRQHKERRQKSDFSANVPIGIGLKYKINKRMNLGVEWAMHFSLSDELDGQKDVWHRQLGGFQKH